MGAFSAIKGEAQDRGLGIFWGVERASEVKETKNPKEIRENKERLGA